MPRYEYRCSACQHEFEIMQKMADAPLKSCPQCQTPSLDKLISLSSFQLKGTGWYQTDFKHPQKPAVSPSTASSDSSKENTKSETGLAASSDAAAKTASSGEPTKNAVKNMPKTSSTNSTKTTEAA